MRDDLSAARIRNLDADAGAAREPLDADRLRRQREREVLGEAHHLVDLDSGGGPELVRRHDRPRVVLGDLALDAELGALRGDRASGLGEHLPVERAGLLALLEQRDRRIGVARRPSAAASAAGRASCGGGGSGLRLRRRHRARRRRDRRLPDRELPGPRAPPGRSAAHPRTANGMSSSEISGRGLLEVLGDDRAAQPLLRPPVAAPRPADGRPREEPGESHAQPRGRRLPRETCVANGIASRTRVIASSTAPVVPIRLRNASPRAAADQAAGLHLLAVQAAPPQREREQHRNARAGAGRSRPPSTRGSGSRVPRSVASPGRRRGRLTPQAAQAEQRVESRRQRGAEAADPVVRARGLPSGGPARRCSGPAGRTRTSASSARIPARISRMPIASLASRLRQNGPLLKRFPLWGGKRETATGCGASTSPTRSAPSRGHRRYNGDVTPSASGSSFSAPETRRAVRCRRRSRASTTETSSSRTRPARVRPVSCTPSPSARSRSWDSASATPARSPRRSSWTSGSTSSSPSATRPRRTARSGRARKTS